MNQTSAPPQAFSKALIINYHYCRLQHRGDRAVLGVTPDNFDRQLSNLAALCEPMDARLIPLRQNRGGGTGCLITFDDGIRDIVDNALPIITRHGMRSLVFCCSLPYLERRVLNVQKTHLLQESWGWAGFRTRFLAALADDPEGFEREDATGLGLDRIYRYDVPETAAFKRLMNVELPYRVVNRVLDRLFESEYGSQAEAVKHVYMSLDDLKKCADRGVAIGVHTHSHCMLSRLSQSEQKQEIETTADWFRHELGLPVEFLSYPYGIRGSWNEATKEISKSSGILSAFTLGRSVYDPFTDLDPFEIPRFDVNDVFDAEGTIKVQM